MDITLMLAKTDLVTLIKQQKSVNYLYENIETTHT